MKIIMRLQGVCQAQTCILLQQQWSSSDRIDSSYIFLRCKRIKTWCYVEASGFSYTHHLTSCKQCRGNRLDIPLLEDLAC